MTVPVILKIVLSLTLILVLNKIVRNLAASVAAGALLIAVWSGQTLESALGIAGDRILSFDNLALMLLISMVISLSSQMSGTGMMKRLVVSLKERVSQKTALAALPAVIGLLPMPGGALFSAPLVDDCDDEKLLSPMEKSRINYWFRHVWEFTWPLYPGVILAADIAGIEVWQIFLTGLPVSAAAALAGYLFYLLPLKHAGGTVRNAAPRNANPLLPLLAPILIVILVYIFLLLFIPAIGIFSRYLPMIIGLSCSMIYLQIRTPLSGSDWRRIVFSPRTLQMVLIVLAVRIYGAYIEAPLPDGSRMIELLRLEMISAGVPVRALIILIPFISGITTGVSVGFVGASFPIVFSLLGPDPTLALTLSTLILAYPFGFMGTMLSPVHVCLIVTNEHFGTSLVPSLASVVKPALLVMAASVAVSVIIPLLL
jgi:integral membrane protein (TIGR00529 family)